jgi:hypothetical protein
MRKSIREFLEAKLRALELSHATGADDRDLPGRIIFWPAPKNAVEAQLHGLLEGLYVAGKINGDEAADWARSFRSALAAPGDPGTVSLRIGGPIPAEVGTLNEPWPQESMIASIEPDIPPRDYDTGSLSLTRVEIYPPGIRLHWRLDLSIKAQSAVQTARKDLKKSPPDLIEFHLTRTFLPRVQALSMSDERGGVFALMDMDSSFSNDDQVRAVTRLRPRPELPAQLTVAWADRTYAFFAGDSGPNA